ncbi:hypothetical protein [Aestuariibacter salexigens]|uniref:hypothetical protein n=1 Tax=Aestuariibacter salexigens TaxID=226010 RepID=UPI0004281FDC|nr:hypothetical protein [Aestuariibacter salexigens]
MTVTQFIDNKVQQLSYYLHNYWRGLLPYSELDLYFWDTLEEWAQIKGSAQEPYSQKERVFWHVLHQMHFWPDNKLSQDPILKTELQTCIAYLDGEGFCPFDCVGIRP